ncbi:MAG: phosphoribosylanthranilate isomerase [Planctomycetes bacterium]|nr:phosphoribosylanthranilate isomerase [Planctomycetota bacterium]
MRTWIKIEGLKDSRTASMAAVNGADAIGLVFALSPRRVGPQEAAEIVRAVPASVHKVGVFVNSTPDEINRVADMVGLTHVQLHGQEQPPILARLNRPCIKAFHVRSAGWADDVHAWIAKAPDKSKLFAVLLDAYDSTAAGGTGNRFNWDLVVAARQDGKLEGLPKLILAGGLDPDCVAEAVHKVRPWGVDVASGVESAPGVKDQAKVNAFILEVRGCDSAGGLF